MRLKVCKNSKRNNNNILLLKVAKNGQISVIKVGEEGQEDTENDYLVETLWTQDNVH